MGDDEAVAFPPELDATRAAPASHRVLLENAAVRVIEVVIEPGTREPVHVHQWPSVMIIDEPAPIRYYGGDGALEYESPPRMSLEPREPRWLEPEGPHSVENIGDRRYHALRIELKPARRRRTGTSG